MDGGLSRRGFCSGLMALAANGLFAAVPAGSGPRRLAPWAKGEFRIHFIHTGAGESQFLVFPDGTTMLLDCPAWQPGLPARTTVPLFPSARYQAGEWVARFVKRANPNGADVDYLVASHFHIDHVGGYYGTGTKRTPEGEYLLSGFALAAERLRFKKAIDRVGPDFEADFMRAYVPKDGPLANMRTLYRHLAKRDGLVHEKARLGARDQIVPLRGACDGFEVFNFCANGYVADGKGGVIDVLGADGRETLKTRKGFENPLSAGQVFRYGAFSYGTFGDFNMLWGEGHPKKHVEKNAAPYVPQLTVAKCNHHACMDTQPCAWIKAVRPRVWLSSAWTQGHVHKSILEKLADTELNPRLAAVCPAYFSAARRIQARKDGQEVLLRRLPSACFNGVHVVITVPPGGKTFRLALVDAGNEEMNVLNEMTCES